MAIPIEASRTTLSKDVLGKPSLKTECKLVITGVEEALEGGITLAKPSNFLKIFAELDRSK